MACWAGALNQLLEDYIRKYDLQRDFLQRVLSLLSVLGEYSRGSLQYRSNPFGFIFHFYVLVFLPSNCPLQLFARTCLSRVLLLSRLNIIIYLYGNTYSL